VVRKSIFTRETAPAPETRPSIPTTAWWGETPAADRHPSSAPLWLALGATTILGALVLCADSRGAGVVGGPVPASTSEGLAFEDATDPALRGVQLAVARVATDAPAAIVPRSSVVFIEGKSMVFVVDADLHLFVATPVELGARVGGEQRIVAGLSAGERVVTGDLSALERRSR
jgi:hypothetical protein